jgi:hypothetical protein
MWMLCTAARKVPMGDLAPIQQEIELLMAVFRDAVDDKDVFDLQYVPSQGVSVIRNGDLKKAC